MSRVSPIKSSAKGLLRYDTKMRKSPAHFDAIDGLRTFAVSIVMLFHFGLPIFAGTIGVDAFFVLSGFLITSIMMKDFQEHEKVRFAWFWSRRLRRLLPGIILVVAFVAIYAAMFSPIYMKPAIASDIFSTLTYTANWHFIVTQSYFLGDGTVSPLLHMWSLAVEEQFYIFWPLIFWMLTLIKPNKSIRSKTLLFSILLVLFSSLQMYRLWDPMSPDRAYMGTDSRAFQIAIGAALAAACFGLDSIRIQRFKRELLILVSLMGLLVLSFQLGTADGLKNWYATGGAFLVALLSALVILGVISGPSTSSRLLSVSPLTYLGKLSYGMYLWHWPIYIFSIDLIREKYPNSTALATVFFLYPLTVLLAAASYHFFENPIRFGPRFSSVSHRKSIAAALSAIVLVGATSGMVLAQPPPEKTLLVVGDSVPDRILPELNEAVSARGWSAVSAAYGNCPAIAFEIVDPTGSSWGPGKDCEVTVKSSQESALNTYRPSAILLWSRYEISDRYSAAGTHLMAGSEEFWIAQRKSLTERLNVLQSQGSTVYLVSIEPVGIGISTNPQCQETDCHWFLERLKDPGGQILIDRWIKELENVASSRENVHVIDLSNDICSDDIVPCTDKRLTQEISRPDGSHFTPEAAAKISEILIEKMTYTFTE
jgi:peptidoglycan/LPS O-acetylase OafA/YrhL